MNRVFLILGSNIDKENNLPRAVALLHGLCCVTAVSSVYETPPVGLEEQPSFFNAAVAIETEMSAAEIKRDVIGAVEKALKRVRTADKNAPRTIDVDIVLFNDAAFDYVAPDGRTRHVPDPDLRRFPHVAVPIAEIAGDRVHPETGQPLAELAAEVTAAARRNGATPLRRRPDVILIPLNEQ